MSKMVLTSAGIAEIINAEKNGTAPVELTHVAFGTGQYTATADRTALQAEFKRFDTISGAGVGDNIIHVSVQDESLDSYTVYEIGVFTESGTLFAVYSQSTPINTKAEQAILLQDITITLGEMNPESIVIGDTNFLINRATTEREGVIELATEAEAKAGADAQRAITPAILDKVIEGHNNIVHRSGYEIIEGQKTFANNPSITNTYPFFTIQQSDIVRGATPATTQDSGVAFVDSKLTRIGLLQSTYTDSGDIKIALYAYKPQPKEDGEFICDALTLVYPASGTPYVTIPEPPPKDNSNKIATTAWVTTKAKEYLPLAGGTMSGAITLDGTASVFAADRDLWFAHSTGNTSYRAAILSGDAYNTGASLYMHGKDYESNPGQFCLQAHDGTKLSALVGNPDGTLVWKNIVLASGYIKKNDKTSGLNICSGQAYNDSPAISLYPSDYSDANMAGRFVLRSGENEYQLTGKSDGTLQWNGTNLSLSGTIQTSANQALVKTDTKGGIQVCGGTNLEDGGSILGYGMNYELNPEFKGALRLQAMDGTNKYDVVLFPKGRLRLGNGTRMNFQDNEDQHIFVDGNGDLLLGDTDGAFIRVCGQESSINPSGFQFRAKSVNGDPIYFIGKPDGTLTWDGKNITKEGDCLPLSGGTMTGNISFEGESFELKPASSTAGYAALRSTPNNTDGAYIALFGKGSTNTGNFTLYAADGTNRVALVGKPDGTLTWGGKSVERVDSTGTNYIRYASGLQICWGRVDTTETSNTVTLPKAFSSTTAFRVVITDVGIGKYSAGVTPTSSSTFTIYSQGGDISYNWIAIGKWA